MKKLTVVFLFVLLGILIIGFRYSPRYFAQSEREITPQELAGWVDEALRARNFTFGASRAVLAGGSQDRPLNAWKNYVRVEPERLIVNLYEEDVEGKARLISQCLELDSCRYQWEVDGKKAFAFDLDSGTGADRFLLDYDGEASEATLTLVKQTGDTLLYAGAIYIH